MDPPVLDQLREREPRHLPADAVERREDHGLRRVVDDEVHAGEVLERADVPALAADDPALHVVGGELDHGHGGLGCVTRGDALERVGDEVPRPPLRLRPRLLLERAHAPGEVVADQVLGTLEQVLLRLRGGHAGDALELRELEALRLLQLLLELLQVRLAVRDPLLAAGEVGQAPVGLLVLRVGPLFELHHLAAARLDLRVELGAQAHRLLARLDLGLAQLRVRLALRLLEDEASLAAGRGEARAAELGEHDEGRRDSDDESDGDSDDDQHARLLPWVSSRGFTANPTRRRPHAELPDAVVTGSAGRQG